MRILKQINEQLAIIIDLLVSINGSQQPKNIKKEKPKEYRELVIKACEECWVKWKLDIDNGSYALEDLKTKIRELG